MKNRLRSGICHALDSVWINRSGIGITFLRVCVGLMMLAHGVPKLLLLLNGGGSEWLNPLGIGSTLSLALCVFAEFFCSLALIVGLLTRAAAMVLLINFWVVVFVVHMQSGGAQAEAAMLYLVCYGTLMCTGAGPYSLDSRIRRRLHYRFCGAADASSSSASVASTK